MAEVDIQNINDLDYVDAGVMIKLAQRFNISIKDRFMAADTPKKRVELQRWLHEQIKKDNPDWVAEY